MARRGEPRGSSHRRACRGPVARPRRSRGRSGSRGDASRCEPPNGAPIGTASLADPDACRPRARHAAVGCACCPQALPGPRSVAAGRHRDLASRGAGDGDASGSSASRRGAPSGPRDVRLAVSRGHPFASLHQRRSTGWCGLATQTLDDDKTELRRTIARPVRLGKPARTWDQALRHSACPALCSNLGRE